MVAAMIDTWRGRATAATGDSRQAARLGHGTVYFYYAARRDEGIFAQLNYDLTVLARVKEGRKPEPTASQVCDTALRHHGTVHGSRRTGPCQGQWMALRNNEMSLATCDDGSSSGFQHT